MYSTSSASHLPPTWHRPRPHLPPTWHRPRPQREALNNGTQALSNSTSPNPTAHSKLEIRGILLSADALPTPTTDASEVAPDKRDFAKRRRAAGHRRHRHGDPPPLGLSRLTCPLRWARPAVTAKMRHHQRLQGHALRRCSAGVERDCRISVLWTPPATQTCTVVHV
jgi:hypothetical protein